jgi:hypothetical protein
VGASVDNESSLDISTVVVVDSALLGDDASPASLVPHAVMATAQHVIVAMNDLLNFIRISIN